MKTTNKQILIDQLPSGALRTEHFRIVESAMPEIRDGEVLLRILYIAVDAAMRAWMLGPSYREALKAGEVMAAAALAEVVETRHATFDAGDLVYTDAAGCQEFVALSGEKVRRIERTEPLTHLLSVYGTAGLTAYFGLLDIGQPRAGESVVVSAAAGAVGSLVGQIAKIKGCHVVGIAGGKAKCDLLVNTFGFDAALDYKAGNLYAQLMAATGGGTDVYFDNVGGAVFESALFTMKPHGRLIACGAVSAYDTDPAKGLQSVRGIPAWFISRRLSLRGFIVADFYARRPEALRELRSWVERGQLQVREDIIDGLAELPRALVGLLAGENIGKRMVKVA